MNKTIIAALLVTMSVPTLAISETNVNISVGVPAIAIPAPPRVVFEAPPLFLAPPNLGFYIGVDMPHDIVFISGSYYLFQGNGWYRARHYNGPWVSVRHDRLPRSIRNHRIDKIRDYREREYRSYQHEHEHYRGRHYRPDKEEKEYRKEQHRRDKEEKRYEKEERKRDKHEHHDRGRHGGHDD